MSKENELGTLIVVVLKAKNLNDKHSFYKQDVFAQVVLNGTTKRTKVDIKGGQHPEWDEEIRFPVLKSGADKHRKLDVSCFAKESRSDDLLGSGTIDITETLRTGEFDDWVKLEINGVARGDIYLEMTYYASAPAPSNSLAPSNVNLSRRPSKLPPAERLSRLSQPLKATPPNALQPHQSNHGYSSSQHGNTHTSSSRPSNQGPTSSLTGNASLTYASQPPPSQRYDNGLTHASTVGSSSSHAPQPQSQRFPGHANTLSEQTYHTPSPSAAPLKGRESSISPIPERNSAQVPVPSSLAAGRGSRTKPPQQNQPPPSSPLPTSLLSTTGQRSSTPMSNPYMDSNSHVSSPHPTLNIAPVNFPNTSYDYGHPLPPQQYGGASFQPSYSAPPSAMYVSPLSVTSDQWRTDISQPAPPSLYFPVPALSPVRDSFEYTPRYQPPVTQQSSYRPPDDQGMPDPYLQARYHTPLPLPPSPPRGEQPLKQQAQVDAARMEFLRLAEEDAARRKSQEEKDLELARQLDLELNLG